MTNTTAQNQDAAPSVDLYSVLGLDRKATRKEIMEAFREKAHIYHPDKPETGDPLKFSQARLARDILSNDRTRANYDAVGAIESDDADNEHAERITALTGLFGQTMHSLLSNNQDPRTGDFVAALQEGVKIGFQNANKAIAQLQNSREKVEWLRGRFRVKNLENPNYMATIVDGQINQLTAQIDHQHALLRQLEIVRISLTDVIYIRGITQPTEQP